MKLLAVDDSSIVRSTIIQHLRQRGVTEIFEASNGSAALALFVEHEPDLVTMDITMPEMDGLTCVSELMKIRPDARILVISALGDEETALDAVERGANGYICKPFTTAELLMAVEELCQPI